MKFEGKYQTNEDYMHSQNNNEQLSYSLSPGKITKTSQIYMSGDMPTKINLKIMNENLQKKNKVLEDDQYKLQLKIKQLEEKLSAANEKNQLIVVDLENSQKTIKNLVVKLEYVNSEKHSLEKEIIQKKEYITKLEYKITEKPPFSTRRENIRPLEKEIKSEELMSLEEELKKKIRQLEKIAIESREKMEGDKKFNSKEILRRNHELTNENNELYRKIEELNDKNLSLKQEIEIIKKESDEIKLESFSNQNFIQKEAKRKDNELKEYIEKIKSLKEEIEKITGKHNEKDTIISKLTKENEQLKIQIGLTQEFNKELDKMKIIIEKLEKESEKLKRENIQIKKEKSEIEEKFNELLSSNFMSVETTTKDKILNTQDMNTSKENDLQMTYLREEMEHVNFEKKKLKEAMNEAINKCVAFVMKEKEWKKAMQEKQSIINNLKTSKKKLKETFIDQVHILRKQLEAAQNENQDWSEKIKNYETENGSLRTLIRKYEKNKLYH